MDSRADKRLTENRASQVPWCLIGAANAAREARA
jgi:hypothetical protein